MHSACVLLTKMVLYLMLPYAIIVVASTFLCKSEIMTSSYHFAFSSIVQDEFS